MVYMSFWSFKCNYVLFSSDSTSSDVCKVAVEYFPLNGERRVILYSRVMIGPSITLETVA